MGIFSALKSAVQAVTGGAAKVSIDIPLTAQPGEEVEVRVTCTSSGGEVKSQGVFVDLLGSERVKIKGGSGTEADKSDTSATNQTFHQSFQIVGPLVLSANETREFTGTIRLPDHLQPTYTGVCAHHEWFLRGRLEAWGNDPDSGYKPFRIG